MNVLIKELDEIDTKLLKLIFIKITDTLLLKQNNAWNLHLLNMIKKH